MIRAAALLALLATPALAQGTDVPRSEAGTAFMEHCLRDVAAARIDLLKRQSPDFAASLTEDQLMAGGRGKARKTCPCFLHVIGISPLAEGATPEDRVAAVVAYLDTLDEGGEASPPPVLATVTKTCGERNSVLPPRWYGQ